MGGFQLHQPTHEKNTHPWGQEEPQSSRTGQELFFCVPADLREDSFVLCDLRPLYSSDIKQINKPTKFVWDTSMVRMMSKLCTSELSPLCFFSAEGRVTTAAVPQSQCSVVSCYRLQMPDSIPSGQTRGQVKSLLQRPRYPQHRAAPVPQYRELRCAWAKIRGQQSKIQKHVERAQKHMEWAQNHRIAMQLLVPRRHSKVICNTLHLNYFSFGLSKRKQMKKTKKVATISLAKA